MQKSTYILGTRIDCVTFEEATTEAIRTLKGKSQQYFATPNPEITLAALKDEKYRKILNNSSLNIPDGMGLIYASRLLKIFGKTETALKERVTGTDLAIRLIELSHVEGFSIFFLGASEESNLKTVEYAKKHGAKIAGFYTEKLSSQECKREIKKANPGLLLVALNFPRQEKWISENLNKLPSVKLAIGVGGAFDFIAGVRKRAPRTLRVLGLEWLYRLIQEPRRTKRIFSAVVTFPMKILMSSIFDKSLF